MQDVKGNQNGYPVPGGIAGPPCPGAYKYGILALQVGDWVTGQQLVTVKKPTVWKPKLWPRNTQIEWNRPRQWKRVNEIRTAILNVHTLYRAGAMIELVKRVDKYKVDVCALQEIRRKNYMIVYSRNKSDKHEFGTGFYISRHIMDNLFDF